MNVVPLKKESVIERARKEVIAELEDKAVSQYKAKLRELERAKIVVSNIEREIADLELSIEHGNN